MLTCSLRASSAPIAMRPTSVAGLARRRPGQQAARGRRQILDAALHQRLAQLVGALLQVDPLQVGADAPDHHLARREQERRHAHDAGHARAAGAGCRSISSKSASPYAWTMRCAFSASTLSWNSRSKPLVTREDDDQRRDAQHDAHRRHRREHGEHAQQERHHRDQPADQDADDARRLDDACRRCGCASTNTTKPTATSARPATSPIERPARTPAPMQVAEADQPLQPQRRTARPAPRSSATATATCHRSVSAHLAGRNAAAPDASASGPRQANQDRERADAKRGRSERNAHDVSAQASSFLDTLRRQTVPYTAMAFPRARRLPLLLCAVGVAALAEQGRARAGKNDLQLLNLCPPGTNDAAGLQRPECAGSSATPAAASPASARRRRAQSRFRSLMSELGVAIAPRLMTPADTLGYAGFQFSAELGVTKINPSRRSKAHLLGRHRGGQRRTRPTAARPDSYLTTVGGFVRKGLWLPLPAFEFGAGALSILGSRMYVASGLREDGAAGRLSRLVAAVVRGARSRRRSCSAPSRST